MSLPFVCAGKTFLLNRIIDALRQRHGVNFRSCVAVTAAAGIAATHIGGELLTAPFCMCPMTEGVHFLNNVSLDC